MKIKSHYSDHKHATVPTVKTQTRRKPREQKQQEARPKRQTPTVNTQSFRPIILIVFPMVIRYVNSTVLHGRVRVAASLR